MLQTSVTTTGRVALAKRPDDAETTITLSGDYTGLSCTIQASVNGTVYSAHAAVDASTGLTVPGTTTLAPSDGTTVSYRVPASGIGTLAINVSAISGGTLTVSWGSGPSTGQTIESNPSVTARAPVAKYTSINVTTGSLAAGVLTGADRVFVLSTNATPGAQLVRTAAQMLADFTGAVVGQTYTARIINSGAGTLTLTTDAGATVTLTGTMTVAQNTWRDFIITFTSSTTVTIVSVGTGAI